MQFQVRKRSPTCRSWTARRMTAPSPTRNLHLSGHSFCTGIGWPCLRAGP